MGEAGLALWEVPIAFLFQIKPEDTSFAQFYSRT